MFTGSTDKSPVLGAVSEGAFEAARLYDQATEEFKGIAGVINAGYGRLVDLAVVAMEEGHHIGPGLHTCSQYIAWKGGVSKATANRIARLARRVEELPHCIAALRAGAISLDQADVIAQMCPANYEQDATTVAHYATVAQLRTIVSCYQERDDDSPPPQLGVTISRDKHGAAIRARVDSDTADLFEKALQTARDDLFRQRSLNSAQNSEESTVPSPTNAEALAALCETALAAGEIKNPSTDRYLINLHLHRTPTGEICLTDGQGRALPDWDRQRHMCDPICEAVLHGANGIALSVGRKNRLINNKLRRVVLFRDRNCCAVPGCDTTVGLEIHHIVHWEHGGSTHQSNLLTLCGHHHKCHHQGLIEIEGNPDLPFGTPGALVFKTPDLRLIPPVEPPVPVSKVHATATLNRLKRELKARTKRPAPSPTASTPTGERLDRRGIHLNSREPVVPLRI